MNEHYEQWNRYSPLGLLLIGFGASLIGYATTLRGRGNNFWGWFIYGTFGLVVLNAGVSVFGDAIKHRALYEMQLEQLSRKTLPSA